MVLMITLNQCRSELDRATSSNFSKEHNLTIQKNDLASQNTELLAKLENQALTQSKLEAEMSSSRQKISRLNFELNATKQEKEKLERVRVKLGKSAICVLEVVCKKTAMVEQQYGPFSTVWV